MFAGDGSGLRFFLANTRKPTAGRSHKAKSRAKPCAVQIHRFAPQSRANSCAILSLVETIIARSEFSSVRAISRSREYHYSSINAERRNSENICTNCGNPALSISAHFRMLLISKHLELFQNGPPLANRVAPA